MQKRWKGRSVNLALLTTRIGDFFKAKDFEAIKGKTSAGYQILAEDSPHFKIGGYVNVTVEGTSDDLVVKFDLCKGGKGRSSTSFFLETMLFGGYFLLRKLKSEEAELKLEKEFWRHVENVVLQLSNSAKFSAQQYEQ